MEKQLTPVKVLLPRTHQKIAGEMGSVYSDPEIRAAIRNFGDLEDSKPIKLDIADAYKMLGMEWKSVFVLYSSGMPLLSIGNYWAAIHNRVHTPKRNYGNRVIRKLIANIRLYLSCRVGKLDTDQLATTGRVVSV